MAYRAVSFAVEPPARFERAQVVLRIVIVLALSMLGVSLGGILGVLYLVLPIVAAILVAQHGAARFAERDASRIAAFVGWVMAAYAYLALLTDRLPGGDEPSPVRFEVHEPGRATVGGALLRLITSIPHAIVLLVLGFFAWILWVVAMILVLITREYPAGLFDFQAGVARWMARLFAWHASLVDAYPPFALDTGAHAAIA